jgi:hypothetical protein
MDRRLLPLSVAVATRLVLVMTRDAVCELAGDDDLLFLDGKGMDEALIGTVERCTTGPVACYDYDLVIAALMAQGMTDERALEWYDVNIAGAWVGDRTPMVLRRPASWGGSLESARW